MCKFYKHTLTLCPVEYLFEKEKNCFTQKKKEIKKKLCRKRDKGDTHSYFKSIALEKG